MMIYLFDKIMDLVSGNLIIIFVYIFFVFLLV